MLLACVHVRHACCTLRGHSLSTSAVFREACRGLMKVHHAASVVARVRLCAYTGWRKKRKQKQNKTLLPIKSRRQRQGPWCIQTPTPPLLGPSRHIFVMAPHRSRGLLVCTQCPLIGRNAKESRRTVSCPVARRSACAVFEIALFFLSYLW